MLSPHLLLFVLWKHLLLLKNLALCLVIKISSQKIIRRIGLSWPFFPHIWGSLLPLFYYVTLLFSLLFSSVFELYSFNHYWTSPPLKDNFPRVGRWGGECIFVEEMKKWKIRQYKERIEEPTGKKTCMPSFSRNSVNVPLKMKHPQTSRTLCLRVCVQPISTLLRTKQAVTWVPSYLLCSPEEQVGCSPKQLAGCC